MADASGEFLLYNLYTMIIRTEEVKENEEDSRKTRYYAGAGLAIGAGIGTIFGLLLSENLALGAAIGAGVGLVIGAAIDAYEKEVSHD